MSKSYNNTIPLFADDDGIRKATMSIVTDSLGVEEPKDPEKCNIFALHKHFSKDILAELEKRYREGGIGYKESKETLADNIVKFITPMRERRSELSKEKGLLERVLEEGQEKAHTVASKKMQEVKKKIGVLL
jgi:tryptophanyl-tRNA synthetase